MPDDDEEMLALIMMAMDHEQGADAKKDPTPLVKRALGDRLGDWHEKELKAHQEKLQVTAPQEIIRDKNGRVAGLRIHGEFAA
jgi:hypothetical protein